MSACPTPQIGCSTKPGRASVDVQSQNAEVCRYLNKWARILEPVRARGGSLKAAGMKRKQYGSYSTGTGMPYHTEGWPHTRWVKAKDFMLCEVEFVRRTNVRRAYGRPPERSNEGGLLRSWQRHCDSSRACLFAVLPRFPNGMILSSGSRLRRALSPSRPSSPSSPSRKRLAPLLLAERMKPWSVVRGDSLLVGGAWLLQD